MSEEDIKSYSQVANQLGFVLTRQCADESEIKHIKLLIQDSYKSWVHNRHKKDFFNWGLWDKKIHAEYLGLNVSGSALGIIQDIYPQLLFYYLIRPLVQTRFFNKRLLDVGCGNGVGLKISTQLLDAKYALGVDLVNKLATNAQGNFYQDNKINFIQSDAENLPLKNKSFDLVTNLESSHLYPQIERFFSEVERVLTPGGYFCYSDLNITVRQQAKRLDGFVRSHSNLKIIKKVDITRMVQASVYQRFIVNEDDFYRDASTFFVPDNEQLFIELTSFALAKGLSFLPWWKVRFKNPELQQLAKIARNDKFWGKKYYFYYLIQKIK